MTSATPAPAPFASAAPRRSRAFRTGWAAVALVAMAGVTPLSGQTVGGHAVAEATDAPLGGVFVTLVDETGRQAAGSLSRSDGRFLVRAPSPGRYVIRAEMIGYAGVERAVELGVGETVQETLRLPLEAIQLEGIVAQGRRQRECALRPDQANALMRLWAEARKSLRIAEWAGETAWLRANAYTYQRVLGLVDLEVLAETSARARSLERQAFAAVDPETIRVEGFVLTSGDGGALYRGADAQLLLSDAFLETHCFGVTERPDDGLVGLTFEPVPDRRVPDITGVLWIDATTAQLRRLEYEYTRYGVDVPLPRSRFGGETHFRHLPGGGVAVERWRIRMPSLQHRADLAALHRARRCGTGACENRETLRHLSMAGLAIEEEGGEVLSFRLADGTRLPAAERAAITGVVLDSTAAEGAASGSPASGRPVPLAGAEVTIQGTEHSAVTDARGRFRIDNLAEGTYRLAFDHPRLDELGIERAETVVAEAAPGDVARVTLATPAPASLARLRCEVEGQDGPVGKAAADPGAEPAADPGADPDARRVIVHGVVRDAATRATIGGARVRLFAQRAAGRDRAGGDGTALLDAETDHAGRFLFCDAPAGDVRVVADYLGHGVREQSMRVSPGTVASADLALTLSSVARIVGRVVRADDGEGVGGVVVRVRESGRTALTGSSGQFAFDSVAPGTVSLETEHLAHRPTEGLVAVSGGELVRVELRVADEVFELEPIVVTARSRPLLMDRRMGGFYTRQARGLGTFIGAEEMERWPMARVTDLLREVPALSVASTGTGLILKSRRAGGGGSPQNPFCSPQVYLDGTRLTNRMGAPPRPGDPPDPTPLEDVVRTINSLPASEIAGIEVYAGAASVPGEFAGLDTQCGVIAIWTRVSDHEPEVR